MSQSLAMDHHDTDSIDLFGFWIYILSDCILFATIFSVYAVLHTNVFGGPGIKEITSLPYVFVETMALLLSSFTYGMSILSLYKDQMKCVVGWLAVTFLFGAVFLGMELHEFWQLVQEGSNPATSAALSSFFTLVGTHGLHVFIGLSWMATLIYQLFRFGLTPVMKKRLTYLGLFWAFLDIIWIFVFTVVYLMGSI